MHATGIERLARPFNKSDGARVDPHYRCKVGVLGVLGEAVTVPGIFGFSIADSIREQIGASLAGLAAWPYRGPRARAHSTPLLRLHYLRLHFDVISASIWIPLQRHFDFIWAPQFDRNLKPLKTR